MSTDSLSDFILRNEQNLRIAVAVNAAWPEARKHIATTFVERLTVRLMTKLQGWEMDMAGTCFEDQYPKFWLNKKNWESYFIALQFADYGQKVGFGVVRDEDVIADRPFSPKILKAVASLQPSAKQRKWWEAYVVMHSPATDWRTPEVLWRIYTDQSFLETVADQLLSLVDATESILDRVARKS